MELNKNLTNDKFQKEAERAAREFYTTLPRFTLAQSRKYKLEHIDPTRVYEDDYWAFDKNKSGKYEWIKLADSGAEVNWLEHYVGEIQRMYIFDPESDEQVKIAKQIAELNNPTISLVMIGGDLEKTVESVGAFVTYLNQSIINEYDLQFTPTVVTRGDGENKNLYRKVRFNIDELKSQKVIDEITRERNEESD